MSDCEIHETSLSALADGELDTADLLPAVDHLAGCDACREFWGDVRTLDTVLAQQEVSGSAAAAPERIWERIVESRSSAAPPAVPLARRPWVGWAAAAAVLAIAGFALWQGTGTATLPPPAGEANGAIEVVLAGDPESMTEERFVELMTEVLRADRRYHKEMLDVMTQVQRATNGREGTPGDTSGDEAVSRTLRERVPTETRSVGSQL